MTPPTLRFRPGLYLAFGLIFAHPVDRAAAQGPDRVDFNFHIRPLLADRCFACHGPDEKARKAGLDLRTRDAALKGGKSGKPSLQPGQPDASELLRRLTTSDPDDRMPPPEFKLPALTSSEIELFRRWIAQGAEFKQHWAFLPVADVPVPAATDTPPTAAGPRSAPTVNEIDGFVRARLAAEGLASQPEASRETLIRRVTLDLTGLPPTLAEIDTFLADPAPDAYERVVDRLLQSPRYGERMAQEWMDLARFADTYGYQADVDVDLSAWRDWVILAFNENLPWDRFITWQLAGDLLPSPTRDQVLATAFNRLHRQTNEGGSIEQEFRTEYVADRVHTMGTAFLGLTLECARCHDHKYDPISQKDYYRLFAYFNSIDESGLYSHFTRATPTPVLLLWEGDAERRHDEAVAAVGAAEQRLAAVAAAAIAESWPGTDPAANPGFALGGPQARLTFETITNHWTTDSVSTNRVQLQDGPVLAPGHEGQALQFSGDNSAVITHAGQFGRTDPFTFSLWLKPTEKQQRAVIFHRSRSWTDSASRGYEFLLDEVRPYFALIHFWPGNAIAVRARDPLPLDTWSQVVVTYDGSSQAAGIRFYRDGVRLATETLRDHLYKDIQHKAEWGDADVGEVHLTLGARFRDSGLKNGLIDDFQVYNEELTAREVASLSGRSIPASTFPNAQERADTVEQLLARHHPAFQEARTALQQARVAENNLITPVREIMVMQELPQQRPAYLLRRGAYDAPTDPVEPGVPDRIMAPAPDLPPNRLGLARWIVDPQNPLTARVAVNRIWRLHFGRGLVATTWDFGAQGQLPSHPELLDWLARRFVSSGWDRKAMHRLVVTSATYRQSSRAPAELLARDPDNRLLARGPRHRLEAEQVRDSALAASGLLVPTIGGPSVKPYQPAGVWEDAGTGKSYAQGKGAQLHRRSLYTFWRRTAPPPSMLTFDATTREVCTAKREITTTPLQSLVLLNDPQYLEAARVLAENLVATYPDAPAKRAVDAFRRLTGRAPDATEVWILARLYEEQLARFRADPESATKYLAIGETLRRPELPAAETAATAVLASTLINHDAFVMKR